MVDRLADDHATAQQLARGISEIPGLSVEMETVETNMVYVEHTGTGLTTSAILDRLKAAGVLASGRPPAHFRFVTSRHQDVAVIDEALDRVRKAVAA
jgi:threonine aldolase